MKHCYNCKETKIENQFYNNKNKYDGLSSECKLCFNEKYKIYYKKNKDKIAKRSSQYYINNKEIHTLCAKNWLSKNRSKHRISVAKWKKENSDKVAGYTNKRKCKKLKAMPIWLTEDDLRFMSLFYKEAKRLTKETTIKHHVDHIIPLQGKNISGLHVPWNLQILTEFENCSKNNKHE